MKTHSLKSLLGGAAVAGTLMFMPIAASAQTGATTTSSVRINRDGIVTIVNAEVTSVTGNIINAITRFKNTVVNWAFSTNASTTVNVANATPATNDILVGDRLNVIGAVTTLGTSLGLNATSIKGSATSTKHNKHKMATSTGAVAGKIVSVNVANGTFVMRTSNDRNVTVQTNANTTFKLVKGTTTGTLANLAVDTKVAVVGTADASGTLITATQVVAKLDDKKRTSNKGSFHGLKNGFKDKEDRDNRGEHNGFFSFFGQSGRGNNNDDDR